MLLSLMLMVVVRHQNLTNLSNSQLLRNSSKEKDQWTLPGSNNKTLQLQQGKNSSKCNSRTKIHNNSNKGLEVEPAPACTLTGTDLLLGTSTLMAGLLHPSLGLLLAPSQ